MSPVGHLLMSFCPWESSKIHFPSLSLSLSLSLSHVVCISSISLFCVYSFFNFLFYFIIFSLLLFSDAVLDWEKCLFRIFQTHFHCQPLTDITVGSNLTQSSLYPFCTLAINSLQKIKFIALTLMLYVAYHAGYHLPFFCSAPPRQFPSVGFSIFRSLNPVSPVANSRHRLLGSWKESWGWMGRTAREITSQDKVL